VANAAPALPWHGTMRTSEFSNCLHFATGKASLMPQKTEAIPAQYASSDQKMRIWVSAKRPIP